MHPFRTMCFRFVYLVCGPCRLHKSSILINPVYLESSLGHGELNTAVPAVVLGSANSTDCPSAAGGTSNQNKSPSFVSSTLCYIWCPLRRITMRHLHGVALAQCITSQEVLLCAGSGTALSRAADGALYGASSHDDIVMVEHGRLPRRHCSLR